MSKEEPIKFKPNYVGSAAVDSGQLMICDPSYIGDQWEEEEFKFDARGCQDPKTGKVLYYGKDFPRYDEEIPEYGKSMNDLMKEDGWFQTPYPDADCGFSYYACCKQTLESPGAGPLRFKVGHEGAGVAFRTAWGDGYYPVYQKHDEDGELLSVEVVFDAGIMDEYNELIQGEDDTYPPSQMRIYTDFDEDKDGNIVFNEEAMREDFETKLAKMKKKFEK
jgi:hypothetical protein